jgi:hypothetical protein
MFETVERTMFVHFHRSKLISSVKVKKIKMNLFQIVEEGDDGAIFVKVEDGAPPHRPKNRMAQNPDKLFVRSYFFFVLFVRNYFFEKYFLLFVLFN